MNSFCFCISIHWQLYQGLLLHRLVCTTKNLGGENPTYHTFSSSRPNSFKAPADQDPNLGFKLPFEEPYISQILWSRSCGAEQAWFAVRLEWSLGHANRPTDKNLQRKGLLRIDLIDFFKK